MRIVTRIKRYLLGHRIMRIIWMGEITRRCSRCGEAMG